MSLSSKMYLRQNNNHQNISTLLDNLLRGYDNSVRPGFGGTLYLNNILNTYFLNCPICNKNLNLNCVNLKF